MRGGPQVQAPRLALSVQLQQASAARLGSAKRRRPPQLPPPVQSHAGEAEECSDFNVPRNLGRTLSEARTSVQGLCLPLLWRLGEMGTLWACRRPWMATVHGCMAL